MHPITLQIPWRAILAVSKVVSTDETRYILNGINLAMIAGDPYLTATDGRRLITINLKDELRDWSDLPQDLSITFRVPRLNFAELGKTVTVVKEFDDEETERDAFGPLIAMAISLETKTVSFVDSDESQIFVQMIEGKYPDWVKAIDVSRVAPGNVWQFNPQYLTDLLDAANIWNADCGGFGVSVYNQGARLPFVLKAKAGSFLAVLMPMKAREEEPEAGAQIAFTPPPWLDGIKAATAPKA